MRVAYFVPYVPNLIRVRSYNLLLQLAKQGIDVTLFAIATNDQDLADAAALKSKLADVVVRSQPLWRSMMNCAIALPTKTPLQSVFSWNLNLQADFALRQNGFDIVHVEHLRGSKYGRLIKSKFRDLPVVWDSVDCISHLFAQTAARSRSLTGKLMSMLELKRTRRAEGELVDLFDHTLITSQVDKAEIVRLASSKTNPISVLPNGADLEFFRRNTDSPRDAETIVFTGKMSYHANVSMVDYLVREIMPKVWTKRPTAKLIIVGKDPPRKVREFAQNPRIEVTGTVADIRPYLWRATVAVVPLVYGAGIQNKILEAMASETPVITTSAAFLGLQANPGADALIGDNADDFSEAILRLIEDQSLQRQIGRAGLLYVNERHDWSKISSQLISIYSNIILRGKNSVSK